MGKYIMAMDQGTTSSRCILFDQKGRMCSMAQKEFTQSYPFPGWVEHDPYEIWSSQMAVAAEAMGRIGAEAADIHGIGITNQRETTIVWDKTTGLPVYPAIVWQCRRSAYLVEKLLEDQMGDYVREHTGLIPDAYFSATKVAWILEHVDGTRERARQGKLLFGTVETWLIWKLTQGAVHVTDYTNASRTMLFDIHTLDWDDRLLSYFGIPRSMLPKVVPSSQVYGVTGDTILGGSIPIAGAAGDQQAALFGQCCFDPGEVKNTYGTGCFLLMNTGKEAVASKNGLLTTLAVDREGGPCYALEGSVFVAGAAIQWLRDELGLIKSAAESEEICQSVKDSNGVYLVPAFTGLGAPYWDPFARGTMVGLTRGAKRAHLVRATVESLAYQVADVLDAMEKDAGRGFSRLWVDGGATPNNFLLQFQADILGKEVLRPTCIETTALGAAYLAGLATGFWHSTEEIQGNGRLERCFSPAFSKEERERKLRMWHKAVSCSQKWAKEADELCMEG